MKAEYTAIGLRVRQARNFRNITQEQLASVLQCNPSHIANIENGKTCFSVPSLMIACRHLGISVDYILYGTSPTEMPSLLAQVEAELADASGEELAEYLRYIRYRKYFLRITKDCLP